MASKRVRLVRCPKCLKILQEDEDVPVYQCGGCSTILQAKRRSLTSNVTPTSVEETERTGASEQPETNNVSNSSRQDTTLSPSGQEGTRANELSETNNVSCSSRQDTVPPSRFSGQDASMESVEKQLGELELSHRDETSEIQPYEKNDEEENSGLESDTAKNTVVEAAESEARSGRLSVDHVEEDARASNSSGNDEISPDASPIEEKNELDENLELEPDMMMNTVVEAAGSVDSSGRLSVDRVVAARASHSTGNDEISPDASPIEEKKESEENSGVESSMIMNTVVEAAGSGVSSRRVSVDHVEAARASNSSGNAGISPDASPIEEKQTKGIDDYMENKTSSAYDGSESSSDEREQLLLDENEQWNTLAKIRSGKFEMMPRYPEEQGGASSSSTFSEKRRNETTTYNKPYPNRSLQLEGPGGRLGRHGRRHVTEQLRPDMPFYPREPSYTRVSPSYPSHDEFDRYSRAHSLQMPPYTGGMNYESADYIYQNNIRARGRGRFSGDMASDRRNHAGWYSGQLHNTYSSYSASPQRPMEQPEYYQRWGNEIVSDVEDHQRNRQAGHHQTRRQCVAKRHVRPTAGGAPFVSCYRCSENLQLPVDFLIFNKKHHLLRCGTCSTVLRFSLQSRTHLVPAVTHDINANRSTNSSSESPTAKPEAVQDEDLPVARGSPLHRLLGYSTVSQVFKASKRPPSL